MEGSIGLSPPMWDVVVVGGGPAGAMAACEAARTGAATLLLERQALPRVKLCGGGLVGASLAALPAGFAPPVRDRVSTATFTRRMGAARTRSASEPFIEMVMRAEFDARLVEAAADAGAQVRTEVTLERLGEEGDVVTLATSSGEIRTRALVGADGSASRIARHVGARFRQVDLGLEVELATTSADRETWANRLLLDFGDIPGSYAWVFPKGDRLTVGTIAAKGSAEAQRAYLAEVIAALGLSGREVAYEGGHLTRCRAEDSPLTRGRVLLAGDAAGLLEPWTREGISFALRSGTIAGATAAELALGSRSVDDTAATYARRIEQTLGAEMRVGFAGLAAFRRSPATFHHVMGSTDRGWDAFVRLSRGDTSLARAGRRRVVRLGLATLGR